MENPHYFDPFRKQIDVAMFNQAFVNPDATANVITCARYIINDPSGVLIMHGSFINGRCENPTSPYFLQEPDQGRRSDLDFILIDGVFFRELPNREKCWYDQFPVNARGNITHSLMYPDGNIKDFLKKPGTSWFSLYTWLKTLRDVTKRKIDFRVYKNWEAWNCQQKSYWLLADARKSYIEDL